MIYLLSLLTECLLVMFKYRLAEVKVLIGLGWLPLEVQDQSEIPLFMDRFLVKRLTCC